MATTLEDKAVQLHKAGKTDAEISSRLGVEERIIHRWVSPAAVPGSFFGRRTKDRAQLHRALDAVMDRVEVRRAKDAGWGKPWQPPANACPKCGGTGTTSNGERPSVCVKCKGKGTAKDACSQPGNTGSRRKRW